jgi:hypothetical protein
MAIYAHCESEDLVQVGDRTRISASKSFVDTVATTINLAKVKPGKNATEISISGTDSADWYIDTQLAFTVDVDATNNKIDFSEGAGELTATVASNNYTLAALATAIKTAMDSAGGTYTVTYDSDTQKLTIASASTFSLLVSTGTNAATSLYPHIGFTDDEDSEGAASYEGEEIETVDKEITVTASDGSSPATVTKTIQVISSYSDRLWSTDAMLKDHEPDILKWVQEGRNTYKNIHRLAQTDILAWLDRNGYVDIYGAKFTKHSFVSVSEVAEWSKFVALRLIFDGMSNQVDDVFFRKARAYEGLEMKARERAVIRIDINNDGEIDLHEQVSSIGSVVVRR